MTHFIIAPGTDTEGPIGTVSTDDGIKMADGYVDLTDGYLEEIGV